MLDYGTPAYKVAAYYVAISHVKYYVEVVLDFQEWFYSDFIFTWKSN